MKNLALYEEFDFEFDDDLSGEYQVSEDFQIRTLSAGVQQLKAGDKVTIKESGMPVSYTIILPGLGAQASSRALKSIIEDGKLILEPYDVD